MANIIETIKQKVGTEKFETAKTYAIRTGKIVGISAGTILASGACIVYPCKAANKLSEGYDEENVMGVGRASGVLALLFAGWGASTITLCKGIDMVFEEIESWDNSQEKLTEARNEFYDWFNKTMEDGE